MPRRKNVNSETSTEPKAQEELTQSNTAENEETAPETTQAPTTETTESEVPVAKTRSRRPAKAASGEGEPSLGNKLIEGMKSVVRRGRRAKAVVEEPVAEVSVAAAVSEPVEPEGGQPRRGRRRPAGSGKAPAAATVAADDFSDLSDDFPMPTFRARSFRKAGSCPAGATARFSNRSRQGKTWRPQGTART